MNWIHTGCSNQEDRIFASLGQQYAEKQQQIEPVSTEAGLWYPVGPEEQDWEILDEILPEYFLITKNRHKSGVNKYIWMGV